MSLFICGDIHSSYTKLLRALEAAKFSDSDTLYCTGDLCDRGDECLSTLKFLFDLGNRFKPVFGNHDIWLYEYLITGKANICWRRYNGGQKTIKEINTLSDEEKKTYADWLGAFPYEINLDNINICHNLIQKESLLSRINIDIKDITLSNARSCGLIRDKDYDEFIYDRSIINSIDYAIYSTENQPDFTTFSKDKIYIFGHTPHEIGMVKYKNFICIDTGAFITKAKYFTKSDGFMTIMNLDTSEVFTSLD